MIRGIVDEKKFPTEQIFAGCSLMNVVLFVNKFDMEILRNP
jgi:hypothetical protein